MTAPHWFSSEESKQKGSSCQTSIVSKSPELRVPGGFGTWARAISGFSAADFAITDEGACRLHPQLARALVRQVGVLDCSETVGEAASLLHVA